MYNKIVTIKIESRVAVNILTRKMCQKKRISADSPREEMK